MLDSPERFQRIAGQILSARNRFKMEAEQHGWEIPSENICWLLATAIVVIDAIDFNSDRPRSW